MKKLFTMFAVCAAALTVSAGTLTHESATLSGHATISRPSTSSELNLRSAACDTLSNLNFATADSNEEIFTWQSPSVGYVAGNGGVSDSPNVLVVTQVGEEFTAPISGGHATGAVAVFGVIVLNANHSDSVQSITAYVYDTTGTSPLGGIGPGNALDSATTTIDAIIANQGVGFFTFTHMATIPGSGFFIMIQLPQVTGDTLALVESDGTTGHGRAWIAIAGVGGASISALTGGGLVNGNYIFADICASSCPTITVSAAQLGNTTGASATASGGVAPYTYNWSGGTASSTTDSVSGLTYGDTYTVTATDHNGCTGTATVSVSTGIAQISAGVANFSVFPNPSNGSFTASISLVQASDVTISIVDMTGSKLYESTETNVQNVNKQINLGTIAAGIYFVNVKTPQGTINQRIAVK